MAFNYPSNSQNNTGVITNHHFATLPGLQPVHDDDSLKQEIPAKSIQFVTTNNASSHCSCSRPHQTSFVTRLSLGRRLINLLPVAQRTNAFTNGVVDRPWVVGRVFESHVHHEDAF